MELVISRLNMTHRTLPFPASRPVSPLSLPGGQAVQHFPFSSVFRIKQSSVNFFETLSYDGDLRMVRSFVVCVHKVSKSQRWCTVFCTRTNKKTCWFKWHVICEITVYSMSCLYIFAFILFSRLILSIYEAVKMPKKTRKLTSLALKLFLHSSYSLWVIQLFIQLKISIIT